MGALHDGPERFDGAVGSRILHQDAVHTFERFGGGVGNHDIDAQRFGSHAYDGDRLRMTPRVDEKRGRRLLVHPVQYRHCLGGRGCFVEQRRVGDVHARQVGAHRLEVQQRF